MQISPDIAELAKALNAAQAEMSGVVRDARNPHFKSRYATLDNVISTAREALTKHSIAWTQAPGALTDGAITITTMLMHASGQWMRADFQMPLAKRDPQGTGSAITYAQRYALMAMLGLPPTDDDDGERAMERGEGRKPEPAPRAIEKPAPKDEDPFELDIARDMVGRIHDCATSDALKAYRNNADFKRAFSSLDDDDRQRVIDALKARAAELGIPVAA